MLHVAERLASVVGVRAVVLGGSRATGTHHEGSDWDFGLYYDGALDTGALRSFGWEGQVFEPGEWSPLMNGGAWFVIDGVKVDVIYRSVPEVAWWIDEASAGRFRVELLNGYLAGFPSYVLVGEVAVSRVLHGSLPLSVPSYPSLLRSSAPVHWRSRR
ncbi:MAG TPA: nucleotidyltransferase domain-containing protein, partial [Acidimicrobiales bacterium]|nr:nucleotidyltransferase domain-containing protein [Acidimicrobiales bacterium]